MASTRAGRVCLHVVAALYSLNQFRLPHLGFFLSGVGREITARKIMDKYAHIKAIITKEVAHENPLLSKKKASHWLVDLYMNNHQITNQTHEELHQWVEKEVHA